MDMVGQDLWVSFMQLPPYMLQTGIVSFVVLFVGVSAGFWTALMGFLHGLLVARSTVYLRRQLAMNH